MGLAGLLVAHWTGGAERTGLMRFMEWSSPKHNVKKIDGVEVECGVEFVEWS